MTPEADELGLPTGPWRGVWRLRGVTGFGRLELIFLEGRVLGLGRDEGGPFQVNGSYDDSGRVTLSRRQERHGPWSTAPMSCFGRWDGDYIEGLCVDDAKPSGTPGTFRMWPGRGEDPGLTLSDGTDLSALLETPKLPEDPSSRNA